MQRVDDLTAELERVLPQLQRTGVCELRCGQLAARAEAAEVEARSVRAAVEALAASAASATVTARGQVRAAVWGALAVLGAGVLALLGVLLRRETGS